MEIANNEELVIQLDEQNNILQLLWKPTPVKYTDDQFKKTFVIWMDALKKYSPKTKSILVDTRKFVYPIPPQTQTWISEFLESLGKCKYAFIVSADIFAQISVEMLMGNVGEGSSKYFTELPNAIEWLKE